MFRDRQEVVCGWKNGGTSEMPRRGFSRLAPSPGRPSTPLPTFRRHLHPLLTTRTGFLQGNPHTSNSRVSIVFLPRGRHGPSSAAYPFCTCVKERHFLTTTHSSTPTYPVILRYLVSHVSPQKGWWSSMTTLLLGCRLDYMYQSWPFSRDKQIQDSQHSLQGLRTCSKSSVSISGALLIVLSYG